MIRAAIFRPALLGLAAGALLALGAGAATAGWMQYGESILVSLASGAWATCF